MKIILIPYESKPELKATIGMVKNALIHEWCIICENEKDIDTWSITENYNEHFLPKLIKLVRIIECSSSAHYVLICCICMENCTDDIEYGESIDRWLVENIERKL